MPDPDKPIKPKKRVRLGRIFGTILFLGIVGAGLYGASWFNARRYFLIVNKTEVRIRKGKMLPYGHDKFAPRDARLKKAYETFPLPGGMNVPRGETTFDDLRELDQALYGLLKDAAEFSLSLDNERTPELTAGYLAQMRMVPGVNHDQQVELEKLGRDSSYVEARGILQNAEKELARAAQLYRASARGGGGRFADGEVRAQQIERAVLVMKTPIAPPPPPIPVPAVVPAPAALNPIQALTSTQTATASP